MDTVGLGRDMEIYLTDKEYRAYEIIRLGKDLGLPPLNIMKELKEEGLSGSEIRSGQKAYKMQKQIGAEIIKGKLKLGGWDEV